MEAQAAVFGVGIFVGWLSRGLLSTPPPAPAAPPCHCHCACECVQKEKENSIWLLGILVLGVLVCGLLALYPRQLKTVVTGSPNTSGRDRGVYGVSSNQLSLLK